TRARVCVEVHLRAEFRQRRESGVVKGGELAVVGELGRYVRRAPIAGIATDDPVQHGYVRVDADVVCASAATGRNVEISGQDGVECREKNGVTTGCIRPRGRDGARARADYSPLEIVGMSTGLLTQERRQVRIRAERRK